MAAQTRVQVIINAKDNASNVIKGVGKSFNNLSTSANGLRAKLASVAGSVRNIANQAVIVTGVIGAGLGLLAKEILTAGANFERMEKTLEVVARNAGISAKRLNDMRGALADVNTFGSAATETISRFLRAGIGEQVDFRKFIGTVKDFAAASGVSSKNAIDAVTTAVIRLQPMLLDQFGIQFNLTQVYKEQAEALGKTSTALTSTEKRQAFINQIFKQGTVVAGVYSATYVTAGKNILSMRDSLVNIKEFIGTSLNPAFREFTNVILKTMQTAVKWFENHREEVEVWGEQLADKAKVVIKALVRVGQWFIKNKDIVIPFLKGMAIGFAAIAVIAPIIVVALNPVLAIITGIMLAMGTLTVVWEKNFFRIRDIVTTVASNVVEPFKILTGKMAADDAQSFIGGVLFGLYEQLSDKTERLKQVLLGLKGAFDLVFKGDFTGEFGRLFGIFEDDVIVTNILALREQFIAFGEALINFPETFRNLVQVAEETIVLFFIERLPFAIGFVVGRFERFVTQDIPILWNNLVVFFTQKVPALVAQFIAWWLQLHIKSAEQLFIFVTQKVPELIKKLVTFLSTEVPKLVAQFVQWFVQLVIDTIVALNELPGKVREVMDRVKETAINKAKEIFEGVKTWFDKIAGFFDSIISKAGEALSRAREAFQSGREAGLSRQTGGTVPGPIGAPVPILAHAGEQVTPAGMMPDGGGVGGGGITFNVQVGLYAGTETEKRNIARELYGALVRVAESQNKDVRTLMGG